VIEEVPVRFRRSRSTRPLPIPEKNGDIELLRKFCNVRSDAEFVLLVAYTLAALRPDASYPVLVITGEQGTCKSTIFKLIVRLVDPRSPEQRSLPRNEDDLLVACKGAHLIPYDNISRMPDWLSDAICRLATGGGAGKRKLFTDEDEVLFAGRRPIMLNGIEEVAVRADLVERAVGLMLEPIPESKRRDEKELEADFRDKVPKIFGAVLDGLVFALKYHKQIEIKDKPRMADFAIWAEAGCRAYWPAGTFLKAYRNCLAGSVALIIEGSTVGSAVQAFMSTRQRWEGTASQLLPQLSGIVGEVAAKERTWLKQANALSGSLRRVAGALRKTEIHIETARKAHHRERLVTIKAREPEHRGKSSSASISSSAYSENSNKINATTAEDADDRRTMGGRCTVRTKSAENNENIGADDADDLIGLSTGGPTPTAGRPELRRADRGALGHGREPARPGASRLFRILERKKLTEGGPHAAQQTNPNRWLAHREAFSQTRRALETLYARTEGPFELVCIDAGSPPL
jgi:hypothetical protein